MGLYDKIVAAQAWAREGYMALCACGHGPRDHDEMSCCARCGCSGYQEYVGRTASATVTPATKAARELWLEMCRTDGEPADILHVLAEADAADPRAVTDLLYAFRRGQLA